MKAAQISEYGNPSVVQVVEVDNPKLKSGQVLIEVHASSLNPFDTSVRSGYVKDNPNLKLPFTLGGDIAGVITEIGGGVHGFEVGDKVYGQASAVAGSSGAFAEFAATSATQIAKAPGNLELRQAASLPLSGVSALQGVVDHIKLQAGQKIFIHGGAGGIGTIAIQIAKSVGAHVATTASGEGLGLVKRYGADEVIDYKFQDFSQIIKDYDAAFDTVAGDDFSLAYGILKKGGIAVSMINPTNIAKAKELEITTLTQATDVTTEALDRLRELVESGAVVPVVDNTFTLIQIQQAFKVREAGSILGKVVIQIRA